jgi:hypothetical protein
MGSHDLRVARPLYITSRHFASGDYGSGGATKGTSEGHSTAKPAQGQKRSFLTYPNLQFRQNDVMLAEKKPKSTEGLSPKILNESPPSKENEPEEVKKHNEELENRSERAHEKVNNEDAEKDKVGPGFWKG